MNSNSTNKPQIIFTFPAIMGGVASFNFNIINNSSLLKCFYSRSIIANEASSRTPNGLTRQLICIFLLTTLFTSKTHPCPHRLSLILDRTTQMNT